MRTFSDFLSLGYLYLLVLGVVSDSIYYGSVGINIMSHSSVLDVLLSPVVHLTTGLVVPIFIILIPTLGYFLLKWAKKRADKKLVTGKKPDLINTHPLTTLWIGFSAWVIFSAYIGLGLGGGQKVRTQLRNKEFNPNHTLLFTDNTEATVRVIGKNMSYVFYIEEGNDFVTVSPVTALKKIAKKR